MVGKSPREARTSVAARARAISALRRVCGAIALTAHPGTTVRPPTLGSLSRAAHMATADVPQSASTMFAVLSPGRSPLSPRQAPNQLLLRGPPSSAKKKGAPPSREGRASHGPTSTPTTSVLKSRLEPSAAPPRPASPYSPVDPTRAEQLRSLLDAVRSHSGAEASAALSLLEFSHRGPTWAPGPPPRLWEGLPAKFAAGGETMDGEDQSSLVSCGISWGGQFGCCLAAGHEGPHEVRPSAKAKRARRGPASAAAPPPPHDAHPGTKRARPAACPDGHRTSAGANGRKTNP